MNYANSIDLLVNGTVETVPILDTTKAPAIVETASGESVSIQDSAGAPFAGLSIFGKAAQDGTPSPENPVPIEIAGSGGTVNISITGGTSETQSLQLSTPNGLPGIPVSSGGNYTDASGQQWISDVIDLEAGTYTHNVGNRIIDDSTVIYKNGETNAYGINNFGIHEQVNGRGMLCNLLKQQNRLFASTKDEGIFSSNNSVYLRLKNDDFPDVESVKSWAISNGLQYLFVNLVPKVSQLSEEEVTAYKALLTNYPNTNIFSDSTPQVGIEVDYVADTKTYIDNKFNTIAQQMLNQPGGN